MLPSGTISLTNQAIAHPSSFLDSPHVEPAPLAQLTYRPSQNANAIYLLTVPPQEWPSILAVLDQLRLSVESLPRSVNKAQTLLHLEEAYQIWGHQSNVHGRSEHEHDQGAVLGEEQTETMPHISNEDDQRPIHEIAAREAQLQEAIALIPDLDQNKHNALIAILESLEQWDAPDAAVIRVIDATVPIADTLTQPYAQAQAWVAIAATYAPVEANNPMLEQQADALLDKAIALMFETQEELVINEFLELFMNDHPGLLNHDQVQDILAQTDQPEMITSETLARSIKFARRALRLGAMEQGVNVLKRAIDHLEPVARERIQNSGDNTIEARDIEAQYGVSTPEEYEYILLSKIQNYIILDVLDAVDYAAPFVTESSDLATLNTVLESAIAATESISYAQWRVETWLDISQTALNIEQPNTFHLTLMKTVRTFEQVKDKDEVFIYLLSCLSSHDTALSMQILKSLPTI